MRPELETLLNNARVGVLTTAGPDGPMGSSVPFLPGEDWTRFYVHLSQLAAHTRNVQSDPRVGLFLCEPDEPAKNPFALKRVSFQGLAEKVDRASSAYAAIAARYQAHLPQGAMMFQLADFQLWELRMQSALLVLGFGQAYRATAQAPDQWSHQRP
jgi:putative heme iron utilization protein